MDHPTTSPSFEFGFEGLTLPKTSVHRRTLSSYLDSRNSSLNTKEVWAEDYFDSDREGFAETKGGQGWITPLPAAATTSRPSARSVPVAAEDDICPTEQPRLHERSLTALLPFGSPKSKESSPKKSVKEKKRTEDEDDMASFTGDREAVFKGIGKGGLSSWFTGSSAPVTVGISTQPISPNQHAVAAPASPVKAPIPQMFNFFSPSKPAPRTIQLPQTLLESDELLTMDIQDALYPSRAQDTFSPASFKNLQMNAEGLLLKMQTAYKLLTLKHHELSDEMSAQEDEFEEAEMRAQHLKAQLDDMSKKFSEQDCVIENLVLELAHERQLRAEEKDAREKSISLIRESRENVETRGSCCTGHSEDLNITTDLEQRRNWRNSKGSTEYESDIESSTESVFSRSISPSLTVTSATSTMTSDSNAEILQASFGRVVKLKDEPSVAQRPKLVQQPSTFQKILRENAKTSTPQMKEVHECANCRGQQASMAWDTVGLLKAENKGLKERVGMLEDAVEDALDMCTGLHV